MCRNRRDVDAATPRHRPKQSPSPTSPDFASSDAVRPFSSSTSTSGSDIPASHLLSSSSSSSSSIAATIRLSLCRDSHGFRLYHFTEILSATDRFSATPLSSSASSWRCRLRGVDAAVFRRPFRGDPAGFPSRVAALSRSHHGRVVDLLGASLADGHIYLVYAHVAGAALDLCLRNPRNPSFTPLASWLSRIQVAADLAQGLEYIHHHSKAATPVDRRRGTVHNRVKSSGVLIAEPGLRAKICHFGAAQLAGEIPTDGADESRSRRFEGTRGYVAPEVLAGREVSWHSDVFAFGTVLLELISGKEPVRYRFCEETGTMEKASLIETARAAMWPEGEEKAEAAEEGEGERRRARIRRWVDRRLEDSFPVEAAVEAVQVALRCVADEAAARPEMVWVAGKLSKLLLHAKAWDEKVKTTPSGYLTAVVAR